MTWCGRDSTICKKIPGVIVITKKWSVENPANDVVLTKLLYLKFEELYEALVETAHCVHLLHLFNFVFQQQTLEGLSRSSLLLPLWALQCFSHNPIKNNVRGSSKVKRCVCVCVRARTPRVLWRQWWHDSQSEVPMSFQSGAMWCFGWDHLEVGCVGVGFRGSSRRCCRQVGSHKGGYLTPFFCRCCLKALNV